MVSPAYAPVVYVIHDDPKKNFLPAGKFGQLSLVLEEGDELRLLNGANIVAKIKSRLARMTPDDYLVLVGNPAAIGIACAVACDLTGGRFNILKWDAQERAYFPIPVDVR